MLLMGDRRCHQSADSTLEVCMPRVASSTDLILDLSQDGSTLKQRLSSQLVGAMSAGTLGDGDEMPSSRVLAQHLGISRAVVVSVYEELVASGFLVATPGGRTRVEIGAGAAAKAGALATPSTITTVTRPAARVITEPPRFNLLPGYPDTGLIKQRAWNTALRTAAAELTSYAGLVRSETDRGRAHDFSQPLRIALCDHLRRTRGIVCDARDIFVFPGVNSAVRTLAPLLTGRGSTFAFENPGYSTARRVLENAGHVIHPVGVSRDGLDVQQLLSTDAPAVYVTPAHQFPLGARMHVDNRVSLLAWAKRHDALIFEDDYDGEFRYDVPPMPALRSMHDGSRHVVYLGTASKTLSRELRLAWAIVPSRFRPLVREQLFDDGDSVSAIAALGLTHYINSGALRKHIVSVQRTYSARRDSLTRACLSLLPDTRLTGINAGLHLVLLPTATGVDDRQVVNRLARNGLACMPLSRYFADPSDAQLTGLVCGYSRLPESSAVEAAQTIRAALL